jgi:hypothetical protein
VSLQQYAGSSLNKFSKAIQSYLDERPLLPGETVKYRLLNGTKNIDPNRKKGEDMLFPSCMVIHLRDRIKDPGKDDVKPGLVEIGAVSHFDDKTKLPVFKVHILTPQKGDGGYFMLSGDKIEDLEMYEVLELKNSNGSNPFRDQSEPPLYERVNEAAESKIRSKKRNFLFDSLDAIRHWTPDEMRFAAASNNLSASLPIDVIKDKLEEIAEKDPETFYKSIESDDNKIKAVIKLAKDAGIIAFSAHENKWTYASGETLALLDRKEGVDENVQLLHFLKSSVNGPAIQGKLEKLLKSKK